MVHHLSAMVGAAALVLLSLPARGAGAIAIDEAGLGAEEVSWGYAFSGSATDAAITALEKCSKPGCQVMIKFTDKCGAYAVAPKTYGVGSGATLDTARSSALDSCGRRDCRVAMAECSE